MVWLKGGVSHLALGLWGKETWLLLWSSALSPGSSPHQPSALMATSPGVGRQAPRALLVSAHQRVGRGWPCGVPTNQVPASLSPAPLGWRCLTPVPSSSGWHLTWGESAGPLRWFLLGEGSAPPSVSLGESWPPGRRVGKEPSSLCAWRWAKHYAYALYLIWFSTVPGDKDSLYLSSADEETEAQGS